MDACHCSHSEDDHRNDVAYPGCTACRADDCLCIAFERDPACDADDEANSPPKGTP